MWEAKNVLVYCLRWRTSERKINEQNVLVNLQGGVSTQMARRGAQGWCAQVRRCGSAQVGPRHSAAHTQAYPPTRSVHAPPCWHGPDAHSSMSRSQLQDHRIQTDYMIRSPRWRCATELASVLRPSERCLRRIIHIIVKPRIHWPTMFRMESFRNTIRRCLQDCYKDKSS